MIKKRYIFLIMFVLLFAVSAVSAAEIGNESNSMANDYDSSLIAESVDENALSIPLNEDEIQGSADNGTFTELQEKINNAQEGSIINLENDYAYDESFDNNGINIDKPLTINGNDFTIDGKNNARIFSINANVTLKNINIINGYKYRYGGAIHSSGFLNIINCSFMNNYAEYSGGALYISGDNSIILNSIFSNNAAKYGAAVELTGGNAIINNSSFNFNYASIAGGAIQVVGTGNIIENSTFNNNIAPYGSAIQWFSENGLVNNSIFINNEGTDTGTIHIISDNITVSNSILINNTDPYDVYTTVYSTVANNNWFGNTLDNQITSPKVSSDVIIDNWHYLDVNTNSETVKIDDNIIINVDLTQLTNYVEKIGYSKELPEIYVNITSANGVCNVSSVKVKDGKAKFTFTPTDVGYGSVTVSYLTVSQTIDFIIKDNRVEPNMTCDVEDKHVGETVEIKANLPSDASGSVIVNINDKNYSAKVNRGQAIVPINDLPANFYDFIMDYSGDDKYSFDSVNGSFLVSKVSDYNMTTSNLSIVARETADVVVYVPSDATGNIMLHISSDQYEVPVINGKATISIPNLDSNMMHGFIAVLVDDPKYEIKDVYGTITVSKVSDYSINAPDVDAISTEPANITVNVPSDATGKITIIIGENKGWGYIKNGTATIGANYSTKGNYTFVASYEGDDKYTPKDTYGVLRVHKLSDYSMNTTDIYIEKGETANIVVNLPYDATGTGNVEIYNDEHTSSFTATVYNGKIIVNESDLTKDSKFVVDYLGNAKYEPKSVSGSIYVKTIIIINAPDVTKYYGGSERLYVTIKEKDGHPIANANIKININGVNYDRTTNENGQTSIALSIPAGNYTATVEYDGIETTANVVIKPTVSGNDITKIYKNATQYYAKFIDTKGNILKNTPVDFNINGVFYTRTTNENGIAKMNINLNPKEYIITATNPNSGEMHSNVVKVLSNIAENHDLTKYYKNASQYVIRLLDGSGKPVGAGKSVQFNINGVFYTRTSNATGHVKMNINLNPDTYIITANYNGLMTSNTIKVLSVLEAKDLSMKYRDGSKFEVKLLDGKGNPFAGQKITFNINGVFYDRTTDSSGIARLNINLMAGEYIITSMYSNGAIISNRITIYENPDAGYVYIDLPSYDTTTTVQSGNYRIEAHQWRSPGLGELDIYVYDSNGNMLREYDYDSKISDGTRWSGSYSTYEYATYHKWQFSPDIRMTQIAVKIK